MSEQNPISRRSRQVAEMSGNVQESFNEVSSSLATLRTEADQAGRLFGFGRRILVPPDEVHVVVGDGRHARWASRKTQVYGGQGETSTSVYWLNHSTQVIKLKTISFTVPIVGPGGNGVEVLDKNKVSFRLWGHAIAKLNPAQAKIAAQRIGSDASGLLTTITQESVAALLRAAATKDLEMIIANRHELGEDAFPVVNKALTELGYDLALLTVTRLDGMAYQKLIEQSEARISKETSIATNEQQLLELEDTREREQREAQLNAQNEEKIASEKLTAQEKINVREHDVALKQAERSRSAAEATNKTELAKVELDRELGKAEVTKEAELSRQQAEREAELRAMQQGRDADIQLAQAKAAAERQAYEQAREIERAAERTEAEAKRLQAEELAAAERTKEIALLEANQLAEAIEVEARSQATALQLKVDAETKAELVRADAETKAELVKAQAEAEATEKRAQASKIRAEALQAERAAPGLADVEIEAARVEVAEKQVTVTRAEGLAEAEVARAQATAEAERLQQLKDVEIKAQEQLIQLYDQAPVLVEIEKMKLEFEHHEKLAQMQTEAYLRAFEAIAPGVRINLYGNGGQASQIFNDVMSLAHGVNALGEEVPAIGRFVNGTDGPSNGLLSPNGLGQFMPYIQQVLAEVNPRMMSTLNVADLVDRLGPVVAGREDLVTALANVKDDANFRVLGDIPVKPLLGLLGLNLPSEAEGEPEDAAVNGSALPEATSS